jgi:Alginate export
MTQVNRNLLAGAIAAALLNCVAASAADTAPGSPAPVPAVTSAAAPNAAGTPAPNSLESALINGKAHIDFRYRFETVDQDGFNDDAYASTLRTRLNYLTGDWHGFTAFAEAANVSILGQYDLYNSTTNGVTDRPVVADPRYTEVNQSWIQFKKGAFTAIGGRQGIVLDNQRFIGTVAWRQNEQTYDAGTLKLGSLPRTQLFYSYVGRVNRVTGPDDGIFPGNFDSNSNLFNAKVDLGAFGAVTLFDYLLDFDNSLANSSNSYGFYYAGNYKFSDTTKLDWVGSYAEQSDYGDNPTDYTADYYMLQAGLGIRNYGLKLGYEVLGGNTQPLSSFQTPLATLHVFQGWADKFLVTPRLGVEDFYVGASANFGNLALQLVWHDFQAEAANDDYGSEWDASAGYKFGTRYEVLAKYANYMADGFATDTTKIWIQLSAAF